jgi:ABC-type glutathione transport system ATPase component
VSEIKQPVLTVVNGKLVVWRFPACDSIVVTCYFSGIPVRADVESPDDELGDDDVQHEKQVVLEKVATLDNQTNVPSDTFVLMEGLKKEFMDSSCCKKQADIKVKLAVKDLNLSVKAGEIFGLLGPNGAGKTTAMNVFTGDMTPTEGRVCCFSLPVPITWCNHLFVKF